MNSTQVKISLLSHGIQFEPGLFAQSDCTYYVNQFVYNQTSQGLDQRHRPPQGLCLDREVFCAILRRETSPFSLSWGGGDLILSQGNVEVARPKLPERPAYFGLQLSDGAMAEQVVAVAGKDIPGFFFSPDCEYWDTGRSCRFCAVRPTRRREGSKMVANFTEQQLVEATQLVQRTHWREITLFFVTTGTWIDADDGARTTSRLLKIVADALEPKVPIHILTMPPKDLGLIELYRKAGATSIAFNMEVFDRQLFGWYCEGKEVYYGFDTMLRALDHARCVFGEYNVFCGFIWGLEPVESTLAGYECCLDHGISISSNVFHADPRSRLRSRAHPTEAVIERLCLGQSRLYERYSGARTIFPCSMRSTLDFEIYRGDFR